MFACHDKIHGYKLYMIEPTGLNYVKLIKILFIKRPIMHVQLAKINKYPKLKLKREISEN